MLKTIEEIREHQFTTCEYVNQYAFAYIHEFVVDESQPVAHRAEALWIMADRGMGMSVKDFDCTLPDDWKPGNDANLDIRVVQNYLDSMTVLSLSDTEGGDRG